MKRINAAESVVETTMLRPLTRRVVVLRSSNKVGLPARDDDDSSVLNSILPDDLINACLQYCDVKSLWAYGLTSKIAASRVFQSSEGRDILISLARAFENQLRQRLSNCARVRVGPCSSSSSSNNNNVQNQSNGFWNTANGHVVSRCAAHTFAEYLDVYPSFSSFLQQKVWSSTRLLQPWCDPVVHQDTIIYASSPTMLRKVTLQKERVIVVESSHHELIGNTKIWNIVLVASASRPSILVLTSDGILHFPRVLRSDKGDDMFGSRLIYTADWVKKALPPATCQWTKGGTLLALRSVADQKVHILRLHCDQMQDFGSIHFPSCNKLALHKSGVLAVSSGLAIQKPVQLWKIQEDQNHVQLPLLHPFVMDNLVYLDFIGESTLLGITERGVATGWQLLLDNGPVGMIGQTKLSRRTDNGPFCRVILWPRRGSLFLITGSHAAKSIHEWHVGTAFLENIQQQQRGGRTY